MSVGPHPCSHGLSVTLMPNVWLVVSFWENYWIWHWHRKDSIGYLQTFSCREQEPFHNNSPSDLPRDVTKYSLQVACISTGWLEDLFVCLFLNSLGIIHWLTDVFVQWLGVPLRNKPWQSTQHPIWLCCICALVVTLLCNLCASTHSLLTFIYSFDFSFTCSNRCHFHITKGG